MVAALFYSIVQSCLLDGVGLQANDLLWRWGSGGTLEGEHVRTIPGRDAGDERRGRLSGGSGGYPGLHPFGELGFYRLDLRHGGGPLWDGP